MSIDSAKKSRGRPKIDSEAVNVRMERTLLNAIDRWRADEPDQAGRPEAIRRLLEAGLQVPRSPRPISPTPPFAVGDRVRHAKFGVGTVAAEPVATAGPDMSGPPWVKDTGWRVDVRWDDPAQPEPFSVADSHLRATEALGEHAAEGKQG